MMIRRQASLSWAALLSLLAYLPAQAQAIVLDHGQTTLGLSYQHTFVRDHVGFDGTRVDLGHIMAYAIRPEISYGLTDRVTVDADAPFSAGKYIGSNPHGRLDDSTFHSTFQDLHLGLRMNVLMQPLAVTPFLRATIPTHHYQLEGHTATGKGTKELTIGTYSGRELAPWSPDAYVEGMLSHTFVQRTNIDVASERLNRTNGTLEVGYYLLPSITLRAFGTMKPCPS